MAQETQPAVERLRAESSAIPVWIKAADGLPLLSVPCDALQLGVAETDHGLVFRLNLVVGTVSTNADMAPDQARALMANITRGLAFIGNKEGIQ